MLLTPYLNENKNKTYIHIPPAIRSPPIFCTVDFGFDLLHPHSPIREEVDIQAERYQHYQEKVLKQNKCVVDQCIQLLSNY